MTTELKTFGGAYLVKDKALKKKPDLKPLAIVVKAATKAIAEAIIFGKLAAEHPGDIDDYFKVKIWEHRDGLPCPDYDVFSTDFFETVAVWNSDAGEPAARPDHETEEKEQRENADADEMKTVRKLPTTTRAYCLAMFGPVTEITRQQYGQILDLRYADTFDFTCELAEALSREPRALELTAERQEQLLAHVRENAKDTAQRPDIQRIIVKWLDTPADKRLQASNVISMQQPESHTDTGATLGGGNLTDRDPELVHNLSTLRIETALAIVTREEEVDIYAIPSRFLVPAKAMAEAEKDVRFTAWWKQLRRTPGILDYSRAAIIALIKSAPEDLYLDPGKLRDYINRALTETNHAKPDQATIDVACGKASIKKDYAAPAAPAAIAEKEAQPKVEKIGEGMFSVENLMTDSTASKQNIDVSEHRQAITPRQIEIAHALNDLLSGLTDIMGKEEAEGVVSCTGHMIPHIMPMLIDTIITTESCLSPAFSDEEIHDVATTILDAWTDNEAGREKVATDAIVQYRSVPELPQPAVIDPPVVTVKTKKPAGAAPAENRQRSSLSYLQQLTIAALQGLAANPVHGNALDDLPAIAADLAAGVIRQQEQADE